ncbi:MAG TPA: hypothetical protein GXX17_01280 [Clostridiales bacterium]|nr:hypothetical protein [Clostridiales bacterium]
MSKRLKSVVAILIAMTLCVSMLSGIFTAQAEFNCTIQGDWPKSGIDYEWLTAEATTDQQKRDTYTAIEDELKYQNDVLNFKIGTKDDGNTTHNIETWSGMLCVQFENYDPSKTDNTGNPWGHTGPNNAPRLWGVVTVPFPGMAFSIKGELARQFDSYGKPALSNEFTYDGVVYQLRWDNTHLLQNGARSIIGYFPGSVANNTDGANYTFRYAVAKYNQDNKHAGKTVGVALSHARLTTDQTILYQVFETNSGKNYVAIKAENIESAKLTGAYVIAGDLARAFDSLGDDMDARFAVTGAPLSDAVNGVQMFENGKLTANGFTLGVAKINSFSFNGEPRPAIIDDEAGTIYAFVKKGTNVTSLTPNIQYDGKSYSPTGAQNFSQPVKYTVTAEDDSIKEYTVKVYQLSDADITSYKISGVEGKIDYDTKTITLVAPTDTDLTQVTPEIATVGDSVTISPSGSVDLSDSWEDGVEFTLTSGSETAKYTVKVRNMSGDNTVKSVVVKADQFKFADGDVTATIDNTSKKITIVYPYGNMANRRVALEMSVADYATVSPEPSTARNQSGATYVVTAENGAQATYTVEVKIAPKTALPPIDDIEFVIKDARGNFNYDELKKVILNEYNYQRSIGFDLGDVSENFSNWDDVTNRLPFNSEMSTGNILEGMKALITVDYPGALGYTIKNSMANAWTRQVTVDGERVSGFGNSGGAAANEFTMDGVLYQQFTLSYGVASSGGVSRVINGIGTLPRGDANSQFLSSISGTKWYNTENMNVAGGVTDDFRRAYESANQNNLNPGVALDGNLKYNSEYDFMYQVFTGTGELRAQERDSSNKSMIISSDPVHTAFVMGGVWQTIYENIPGYDFVELNLDGFSFKYAPEIGVPIKPAYKGKNDEWILEFEDWYAYATEDDPTNVQVSEGGYFSKENYVLDIEFEQAVKSINIMTKNPDLPADPITNADRIDVVFYKGTDLSNLVIKSIQVSEGATANVAPGSVLDCTWGTADIKVTAEDGSSRIYVLYASVDEDTEPPVSNDPGTSDEGPDTPGGPGSNPKTGQAAATAMLLMLAASGGVLLATRKRSKKAE